MFRDWGIHIVVFYLKGCPFIVNRESGVGGQGVGVWGANGQRSRVEMQGIRVFVGADG